MSPGHVNINYHFWFFFEEHVPASLARNLISPLAAALDRDCRFFNLEVFPKQDQLQGKGLGNLVKLPLGIHRASGKPSYFPDSFQERSLVKHQQAGKTIPHNRRENQLSETGWSCSLSTGARSEKKISFSGKLPYPTLATSRIWYRKDRWR
ncbi:hypothetical protein [Desulfonatronospira sp.]|uniref:TOTE conflict system archaeo-eukaryotic primase domain-containing protein n=1 Tax=Desulfonatronospira sp. TaxID=1962951 RepID=UPI0025C2BDF6|nr:hypothetical protein [Desulfonatronospira sp.]